MTYKKTLLEPISNHSIGSWNKVTVENLPIGVDVFVTFESVSHLDNAKKLTDILKVKNNNFYAQPRELFIHTMGTSAEDLILDLVAITNTNDDYFENIPKQELSLKSSIEESLLTSLQFQGNSSLLQPINSGTSYELITDEINSIKWQSNQILELEINNNGVLFAYPANEINMEFLKKIDSIKFHNNSTENTVLSCLVDGVLSKDKGVFTDDVYSAGVFE